MRESYQNLRAQSSADAEAHACENSEDGSGCNNGDGCGNGCSIHGDRRVGCVRAVVAIVRPYAAANGRFARHRAHVRRWTKSSGNAGAARSSGPTRSASHIFHDRQARSRVSENRSRCGRTWARRCESYRDASEPGFSLRAQSWRGAGEMPRSDIVSDGPRSAMDASAIWRARAESRSNGGREWNRRSGDVVEMGARLEGAAGRGGD